MTQVDIDDALESVRDKYHYHQRGLQNLEDDREWLKEDQPNEYKKRRQTHEAWMEITDKTLEWLLELEGEQKTISDNKFIERKVRDLKEVYDSGKYPYAELPEPKVELLS